MSKLAYVTGGMGGIGTAICRKFHDAGYKVVAGCGPTRDYAKWIAEQKKEGYTFFASAGNVSNWESTKAAFDKVKAEHGVIDILVSLLYEMKRSGAKKGLASLCIGGGMGVALAVER